MSKRAARATNARWDGELVRVAVLPMRTRMKKSPWICVILQWIIESDAADSDTDQPIPSTTVCLLSVRQLIASQPVLREKYRDGVAKPNANYANFIQIILEGACLCALHGIDFDTNKCTLI